MKILLLNDFGTATGGAELQILSLRQGLRERGHEVRLLSSSISPIANTEVLSDYCCFGTNTKLQVLSQTVNPSAYLYLRQILHDFKPDVVHVRIFMGQLSPLILPLLKDVPCLYQTAMYRAICPTGKKILPDGSPCQDKPGLACLRQGCLTPPSWFILMIQRQLWQKWRKAFDLVVALSYGMKNKLEAEGIKPVQVVYNGVPERPKRPPLSDPPLVAFAGRLSLEKGVKVLLEAFAQVVAKLPQARLLIAGQGNEKTELVNLAEKLGISQHIIWLGHLSRTELENHFDSAWVQVVPSLWDEPFGNVTTEAMMRGTAVIASAVGAQPEIVKEGVTGFLVPPNDVERLANALVELLFNPQKAEKMGQAGRERALTHFSENRRTEHFLELYQQIYQQYYA
ncbi:glycosyltransferase family 1 protein [Aphanothece hegewaldii CCALA 016]|uniref:Glycosyltransferase family 1 protein n=1 Tax=Aphanothece hegewaldii CCALA 016 TaxID=2107694 RepID=A0A2T1M2V8_9CHRO|nr:glycosyltransferase family 4 protein [Aphanothece hegewaldii]PSF39088.1 glycosyltransferase family 1 protein [Aphanothece hegewaldii CCALA 016]